MIVAEVTAVSGGTGALIEGRAGKVLLDRGGQAVGLIDQVVRGRVVAGVFVRRIVGADRNERSQSHLRWRSISRSFQTIKVWNRWRVKSA